MPTINLQTVIENIPANAKQAVLDQVFALPLLAALGFQRDEVFPEYDTGDGHPVDRAARKTIGDDVFLYTKSNPYLLIEFKGRDVSLAGDSASYRKTVEQLKGYLLAKNCRSAQWGIITNSIHIQLFRKHGRVIHPATPCLEIDSGNIDKTIALLKQKIEKPTRALTVAIYNNKGGVGKTTTTVNLAAILTLLGKRVLAIDFDPNQQDLTNSLGLSLSEGNVHRALTERNFDIRSTIKPYSVADRKRGIEVRFDVVPADRRLVQDINEIDLRTLVTPHRLRQILEKLNSEYDYILIDAPPNWRLFSQQAVYASDVVLIPTKHNNLFSLENAATAIKQFIPQVQKAREDGSPIALPIFFNGEKTTDSQKNAAHQEIAKIVEKARKEKESFNLLPYFYPRGTNAKKDNHIFEVPSYAHIANSAFSRIPAVYRDKTAREYYLALAKEYFLQ